MLLYTPSAVSMAATVVSCCGEGRKTKDKYNIIYTCMYTTLLYIVDVLAELY